MDRLGGIMASSIKIVIDDSVRERIEVAMKSGVKIWNAESVYLNDLLCFEIDNIELIKIIDDKNDSYFNIWTKYDKESQKNMRFSIKFILSNVNENKLKLSIHVYCDNEPIFDYVNTSLNSDCISLFKDESLFALKNIIIRLSSFSLKEEE